jgi:hypothetical protein
MGLQPVQITPPYKNEKTQKGAYMQINCKNCGTRISSENINLSTMFAKCASCDSVFSFQETVKPNDNDDAFSRSKTFAEPLPLPKRITLEKTGSQLIIKRRWFSLSNVFLTFFVVFWDTFMIVWFSISIATGAWPMAAFGSLHAGVGIWLTYRVLANYLNTTEVVVDNRQVSVRHYPLPWPGNKVIPASTIEQLYCKSVIHRGKNSVSYSYEVHTILSDKTHTKFIGGLEESEQALYIEQEIEDFLRIENTPVRGEMGRG